MGELIELERRRVQEDARAEAPPGWTVERARGAWCATRRYIPGAVSGATVWARSAEEACEAARRFEGVRE